MITTSPKATGGAERYVASPEGGVGNAMVRRPKSWSLAAALHPDISVTHDAAQDRAAEQIIGWLAQHATVRVGARDQQVQVPVERIEAATVRHYTPGCPAPGC